MTWTSSDILLIAAFGLIGGSLGGLLGLGGAVFAIPALTLAFGPNQHLYQASALIMNIFVAAAATSKHRGRGTIRADVAPVAATASAAAALLGVFTSNLIPAEPLMALFGLFLCYCAASEVVSLALRKPDTPASEPPQRPSRALAAGIGALGGFAAGLLGIGGGALMVPLFRKSLRLPIREAVANSAVVMIVACAIAATAKNASIQSLLSPTGDPLTVSSSLWLAALLAPTATLGGMVGAMLVYRLPLGATRVALALLLGFAGIRMAINGLT